MPGGHSFFSFNFKLERVVSCIVNSKTSATNSLCDVVEESYDEFHSNPSSDSLVIGKVPLDQLSTE